MISDHVLGIIACGFAVGMLMTTLSLMCSHRNFSFRRGWNRLFDRIDESILLRPNDRATP